MRKLIGMVCVWACAQQPTFRAESPLVAVPVLVTAKSGEAIMDLNQDDFRLLDNNMPRAIKVTPWSAYDSTIALVVVVETSSVSQAALLKLRKAPAMLDGILGETGQVAVVTADSMVQTYLDFSSRWVQVQEAFESLSASAGKTGRILDGVSRAIDLLAKRPALQRRIVLLISEGKDRGSESKASDVLTRAQQENVTIYSLNYSAYLTPFTTKAGELRSPPLSISAPVGKDASMPAGAVGQGTVLAYPLGVFLQEIMVAAQENVGATLSLHTGGSRLSFLTLKKLEEDLAAIGKEVHSEYLLTFRPDQEDVPVYHKLIVAVKGHDDAEILARPGYWNGAKTASERGK